MGITSIVSSSDLLVVVPHRLAKAYAELVDVTILELPIEIPSFHISQYWHERFHTDPGNRWLRGLFAQLYGGRQTVEHTPQLMPENDLADC
jgi:DNA-binding transcriptional LysR family regulator